MNKSEAKFRNTAIKMNDALLRLLERKEFNQISIREICEEASVNRSTFYAHYENTYDLLEETHKRLVADFIEKFPAPLGSEEINRMSADELIFVSPQYLIPYLRFIKENRRIFKTYQTSNAFNIDEADKILIKNIIVPIYAKNGITDETVINYMAKFFLSGITAITMEWVNRDCRDDILFVCEIISFCVRPTMKYKSTQNKA